MKTLITFIQTTVCILIFNFPMNAMAVHFLEDGISSTPPPSDSLSRFEWPRMMLSEIKNLGGDRNKYTKYPILAAQGSFMTTIRDIQNRAAQQGYETMFLRMFTPLETQEHENSNFCSQSKAIPFETNGATTDPAACTVYSGHWLYGAGSRITTAINGTSTVLEVANSARFHVNQFVVVYDAPAGSFNNAEHMYVESINTATNELILGQYRSSQDGRGYRSTRRSHANGSIVAGHVSYNSRGAFRSGEQSWAYNMSTQCPVDANGNQLADVMSTFIANNFDRDPRGNKVNMRIDGILFDLDANFNRGNHLIDDDNNLVIDEGFSPTTGVNWWGEGVDRFYAQVRALLPDMIIVGGTPRARGYASMNGNQEEGWVGWFGDDPNYFFVDELMAKNHFDAQQYSSQPLLINNLSKQSSLLYPDPLRNPVTSNSDFRLGLALAMLESGFFGTENSPNYPDQWFDEYAVDTAPGSANYGRAIPISASLSALRDNQGWMGKPLGSQRRLYDPADYAENLSLMSPGKFDNNLNGWSGHNVNINRTTNTVQDGAGAIQVSPPINYHRVPEAGYIGGPSISITAGEEYTIAFSVKASAVRTIEVLLHDPAFTNLKQYSKQEFMVPADRWARRVHTFKAEESGTFQIRFNVGKESTTTWFDSVYVFHANANVFRRDFENGIVVANATPSPKTINLNGTFQRIDGTQDPINNGASVTSVTLPAYDAAILVRPMNQQQGVICGAPTFSRSTNQNLYLWKDCNSPIWFARTTSGGSTTAVNYSGSLSSSTSLIFSNPFDLENGDTVNDQGDRISFNLNVANNDVDGFLFKPATNASVCFGENMPAGTTIVIGANNTTLATPVNLTTFESCGTVTAPPSLSLQVTANGSDASIAPGPSIDTGSLVSWHYTVTNTGGSTINTVKVFGQQNSPVQTGWSVLCELGNLSAGATASCDSGATAINGDYAGRISTQGDATNGSRIRKGFDVFYQGTSTQTMTELLVDIRTNGFDNDNAEPGPTLNVGDTASFTYTVRNTGNVPLENIKVFDRRILPVDTGFSVACTIALLLPNQSAICEIDETVISGQVVRQAAAQAPYQGNRVVNSDVSFYVGQ